MVNVIVEVVAIEIDLADYIERIIKNYVDYLTEN